MKQSMAQPGFEPAYPGLQSPHSTNGACWLFRWFLYYLSKIYNGSGEAWWRRNQG